MQNVGKFKKKQANKQKTKQKQKQFNQYLILNNNSFNTETISNLNHLRVGA